MEFRKEKYRQLTLPLSFSTIQKFCMELPTVYYLTTAKTFPENVSYHDETTWSLEAPRLYIICRIIDEWKPTKQVLYGDLKYTKPAAGKLETQHVQRLTYLHIYQLCRPANISDFP